MSFKPTMCLKNTHINTQIDSSTHMFHQVSSSCHGIFSYFFIVFPSVCKKWLVTWILRILRIPTLLRGEVLVAFPCSGSLLRWGHESSSSYVSRWRPWPHKQQRFSGLWHNPTIGSHWEPKKNTTIFWWYLISASCWWVLDDGDVENIWKYVVTICNNL